MRIRDETVWVLLPAFGLVLLGLSSSCSRESEIVIGRKDFTEQQILAEIVSQHLAVRLNLRVSSRPYPGSIKNIHNALVTREIDLYPEYTGTALRAILALASSNSPKEVLQLVRSEYRVRWGLDWLEPLGFDNSFAMTIRGQDARTLKIETLSAASSTHRQWTVGAGPDFAVRPDGLTGLARAYQLNLTLAAKTIDLGLLYKALDAKEVDMVAGNATDGLLSILDARVLTDDKKFFPPYEAAIVVRSDTLRRVPQMRAALQELAGTISNTTMQKLNFQVDGVHRPAADVAREFLKGLPTVAVHNSRSGS